MSTNLKLDWQSGDTTPWRFTADLGYGYVSVERPRERRIREMRGGEEWQVKYLLGHVHGTLKEGFETWEEAAAHAEKLVVETFVVLRDTLIASSLIVNGNHGQWDET